MADGRFEALAPNFRPMLFDINAGNVEFWGWRGHNLTMREQDLRIVHLPPKWVSPDVDFTSKIPSSIVRMETSKVPPPKSKMSTLRSPPTCKTHVTRLNCRSLKRYRNSNYRFPGGGVGNLLFDNFFPKLNENKEILAQREGPRSLRSLDPPLVWQNTGLWLRIIIKSGWPL